MKKYMSDNILKDFKVLEEDVCRDIYNLTRDDHDSILVQINKLKDFIEEKYRQRNCSLPNE